MIILEQVTEPTKDDKFNGLTLRHPQAAHTRSTSLLPDYDTSEAQHRRILIPPSRFKLDSRTWRASLYAFGVYIFLTLTIAVPIIVLKSKNHHKTSYPPPNVRGWAIGTISPPPNQKAFTTTMPSDQKMTCNNWQMNPKFPNSLIAFFELPPTGLINIRSNATDRSINPDQLNGTLSVLMNNSPDKSSILFTIEMQSSSQDVQDQTTVCFSEEGSNRGLLIYIPSNIGNNALAFNISVVLPQVNSNVANFVTYLPMFSQTYGDLRQYITFDQFTLEGSGSPIYCDFLQACQIRVTNILAPIQGSFNVTDSLILDSIQGPLITDITLSPKPVQGQPTVVYLGTGDSAINASIKLNDLSTTPIPSGFPVFAAQIKNFNGPLQVDVAYENTSLISPFQLLVQNTVDQTTINMDASFQGCFSAQTKLSEVFVKDTVNSQGNTTRIFDYDTETLYLASGWVGSEPRPPANQVACPGFVSVFSSLGPVNLTFGS